MLTAAMTEAVSGGSGHVGRQVPPHVVDYGCSDSSCLCRPTTFCYGVPEPDSLDATIDALQVGQRVRIEWEGVVTEPYARPGWSSRSAVVARADDAKAELFVLRYTGVSPHRPNVTAAEVAGLLHGGITSVEVLSVSESVAPESTALEVVHETARTYTDYRRLPIGSVVLSHTGRYAGWAWQKVSSREWWARDSNWLPTMKMPTTLGQTTIVYRANSGRVGRPGKEGPAT